MTNGWSSVGMSLIKPTTQGSTRQTTLSDKKARMPTRSTEMEVTATVMALAILFAMSTTMLSALYYEQGQSRHHYRVMLEMI